ncbi:hypothetical protein Maq22A_1p38390 (plasmid) [Methylobacterium aquaticum]|uniref:Uncharacterized protein n=1 Tax=Methylobacterium aquaticum TaxID=270351 RepID=A0A1Y0ZGF6_9HYPH|nr:hypothetical protein Maq22A_1p38390 [Methylobacterium aquaticum]
MPTMTGMRAGSVMACPPAESRAGPNPPVPRSGLHGGTAGAEASHAVPERVRPASGRRHATDRSGHAALRHLLRPAAGRAR